MAKPNFVDAPISPHLRMVRRLAELLEDDPDIRAWFDFEDPDADEDPDMPDPTRRRIFFDDNGTCDPNIGRKLILAEFTQDEFFATFGEPDEATSEIGGCVMVHVYVHVPKLSTGEPEKIAVGNLHCAVRQKIRGWTVEPSGMWENIHFIGEAGSFEQSDNFRRVSGLFRIQSSDEIT